MAASSADHPLERLVIVGLNHRTAALELREQLMLPDPLQQTLLSGCGADGLAEAALLLTCDRIELIGIEDASGAGQAALGRLERLAGLPLGATATGRYQHRGKAALGHLFRVAASLDAQIVGEPHILGQVKAAQRRAVDAGAFGSGLDAVFAAAYAAAKRVRSETSIGVRAVSLAACAVQLVRDLHGALAPLGVLLIGSGEVGEYLAEALRAAGVARFAVATRSEVQGRELALRFQAHRVELAAVGDALVDADLVITAMGSGRILVAPPAVRAALRRRRQRPIFFIDAGMPGDVDPAVGAVDQAFVYTIADLEAVAMSGRAGREAVLGAAQAIVDQAVDGFVQARAARAAVPTVVALREHFEALRNEVLASAPAGDAASVTRALVNRLLHTPSAVLREAAGERPAEHDELRRLVRRLFGLDDEENGR